MMRSDGKRDALPRSSAEAQGVSSGALLAFVDRVEREVEELHSLMVVRHGQVVAEGWWSPYAPDRPHQMYSLSKSFTATAVGLAAGEGLLSLDDRVVDFFPEDAPASPAANLAALRVRHLLTMTTGHTEDTLRFLWEVGATNWVAAFLTQPIAQPPETLFVYNSGATYVLSAIVQKVTGQTLMDYLTPRLFAPLGIHGATWESSPQDVNTGGWGLNLRTEDIAKFGQLYLQGGVWQGERLLPLGWTEEATARQVPNGDNAESDWAQGYSYQFWRSRWGAYRGDGACGQFCIVLPDQDAVLAITAGTKDMQKVLNLIWDCLLPALGPAPLSEDAGASSCLREKMASLALPRLHGLRTAPIAPDVSGVTYHLAENPAGVETLTAHFTRQSTILEIRTQTGEHRVDCGVDGAWIEGTTALATPGPPFPVTAPRPVLATGVWMDPRTYTAKLCFVETPFSPTITAEFVEGRLLLDFRVNAAFGRAEWPQMVGGAAK